jgi:hypothetical protein
MIDINRLKDKAIILGWIVVILSLISLLWALTSSVQKHHLLKAANSVLIEREDTRRLVDYTGPHHHGKTGLLGYWYSMMNSSDNIYVFSVFHDGILIPMGAIISGDGKVSEVIPLSAHAVQVKDSLPESIIRIYTLRIENAYRAMMEGKK